MLQLVRKSDTHLVLVTDKARVHLVMPVTRSIAMIDFACHTVITTATQFGGKVTDFIMCSGTRSTMVLYIIFHCIVHMKLHLIEPHP